MAVEKVEKYLDQLVAEMEKPLRDATPMDKEAILNHFEKMGELPADLREALKRAESLCSDISQRGQQLKKVCLATLDRAPEIEKLVMAGLGRLTVEWAHSTMLRTMLLSTFAASPPIGSESRLAWSEYWEDSSPAESQAERSVRQQASLFLLKRHFEMLLDTKDKGLMYFFAEEVGTAEVVVQHRGDTPSPAQREFMKVFHSRMPSACISKYQAAVARQKSAMGENMPDCDSDSLGTAGSINPPAASKTTTAAQRDAASFAQTANTLAKTGDELHPDLDKAMSDLSLGVSINPTGKDTSIGGPASTGAK